jgi:3-phenylpropionate/trans-cinnamate dioxygenase ferredoxin subunit
MAEWLEACDVADLEPESVRRFDSGAQTYAIYRSPEDTYFATAGFCTHRGVHLAGGTVMEHVIECPKHAGLFDYTTGEAMGAPVCINLQTFPVKIEGSRILIEV